MGALAKRRSHVRPRGSQEAHLLMRWRFPFAAMALALMCAAEAIAGQDQYLGRIIVELKVEVGGQPSTDTSVLQVIETRVGEPFSMIAVRSTVDHLVGIGRFEDVRVDASPLNQGVALRWILTPIRRIVVVSLNGSSGVSESAVRTEL